MSCASLVASFDRSCHLSGNLCSCPFELQSHICDMPLVRLCVKVAPASPLYYDCSSPSDKIDVCCLVWSILLDVNRPHPIFHSVLSPKEGRKKGRQLNCHISTTPISSVLSPIQRVAHSSQYLLRVRFQQTRPPTPLPKD